VRRIVLDPKVVKSGNLAAFTPHDLRRMAATIVQAARLPIDFVKALLNHHDKGVTGVCARWHMFEEKREAVNAINAKIQTGGFARQAPKEFKAFRALGLMPRRYISICKPPRLLRF
jgi:hypothetical protein